MNSHKIFFRRSFAIMLAAMLMFALSACSTEENRKTESYVSSVKTLVDESVNSTRLLKNQKDEFDCHNAESSKAYISTLSTLSDLYEQLLKLESPQSYDDIDESIKLDAEKALSAVTEMKTLAQYAFENTDDFLYQKDIEILYSDYQESYNNLVSLSSEVQTRFRNA